jgi:hypothetical protein
MSKNIQIEDLSISINDAPEYISTMGHAITYILRGEPGIGKSYVKTRLEEIHGDKYEHKYVDCPTLIDGDLGYNAPNRETKTLEFMVADIIRSISGKPVIVMLDEYLKVDQRLQKQFTRFLLEHTIGDYTLPKGSIVFATSNLTSDGVNDVSDAHVESRVSDLVVRKPNAKEWCMWASNNGISARLMAWVMMRPECLASYVDGGQDENPFIFNPYKANSDRKYVCPRSLVKADKQINGLPPRLLKSALAGTVGRAAADNMLAFFMMEKDLIAVKDIIKDPMNVAVPDDAAAILMTYFSALETIETQDQLAAFMQWSNRSARRDLQGVFLTMLCQSKRLAAMAMRNAEVGAWAKSNFQLMV